MKKSMYRIIIVSLVMLAACEHRSQDAGQNDGSDEKKKGVAEYALSLDSAKMFVQRYDSISRHMLDTVPVKSFTVRSTDLLEVLGVSGDTAKYRYVRIYLGVDFKNGFKVFLTPVVGADLSKNKAGKDKILSGQYVYGSVNPNSSKAAIADGQYVLDFTSPCPNTCPDDSPFIP